MFTLFTLNIIFADGFVVILSTVAIYHSKINKHFMTGSEGNSEFCFPETSMFPEARLLQDLVGER